MENRTWLLLMACAAGVAIAGLQAEVPGQQPEARCANVNLLSPAEQSAGWLLLFDGRSTAGWHVYNKQETRSWAIDECSLKTTGTDTNYGSDKRPDLVTDREFTNFELVVDWKGSKGGTAHHLRHRRGSEIRGALMTGPEYQLLDDAGFQEKVEPYQKAGSNYGMQAPNEAIKILKPIGEWNTTRIVVKGTHVEHWLNGRKIVEFERWTPAWKAERDRGKWKEYPDYGMAKTGRIALQDHGSVFWFRNVKIRPLAD
jgi:hypothetical protein